METTKEHHTSRKEIDQRKKSFINLFNVRNIYQQLFVSWLVVDDFIASSSLHNNVNELKMFGLRNT